MKQTTLLLFILACFVLGPTASAQDNAVAVVVNPQNPASNLTLAELRKLFAGERHSWASAVPVRLIVRGPGTHEREALLKLLDMSESEYKQYWAAQVFRGEAQSEPVVVPSIGMQKEAVSLYPGAITLVDAQSVKPGMKVIKINGQMPAEPGYPLQ